MGFSQGVPSVFLAHRPLVRNDFVVLHPAENALGFSDPLYFNK